VLMLERDSVKTIAADQAGRGHERVADSS
jgi:hypothetical protein